MDNVFLHHLWPSQRVDHGPHQEQRRQQRRVSVPHIDVIPRGFAVGVGRVKASVVYPDIGPKRRAEYLAKFHRSKHDHRDPLSLQLSRSCLGRPNSGTGERGGAPLH